MTSESTTDKSAHAGADRLQFEDDPGARRPLVLATTLLIAIVAWMGSGFILPTETEANPERPAIEAQPVTTRISRAEEVTLYFNAEGQAEADRDTAIRAEASGEVAELLVDKGTDVTEGQLIARLTTDQVEANLRRAREARDQAQREFDNATALLERGVATQDRLTAARAALAAAEADLIAAEQSVEDTAITAPFAGRIETLSLDPGEYIAAGTEIGRIVDHKPLTVALQVPQQALNRIKNGQQAQVSFITGETETGEVTFVGTSAAAATRTFLAEIEVPNDDGAIPAGISAEIRIPTGTREAHFISPSLVSLDPNGVTGVKTVEDGKVRFHEIELVRAEVDGIWVTGIPDTAEIIVIGQGYVRDGEEVRAQREEASE
ncbi:efflux RND transporter periplasmic adaptor subunit [Poseidonocella sedimentorum]|uniref:Membrane fusion protein, multidrug efflux system n=1 Tax=Poseidonocella sedimentorum TaxID=871652 RepID=A0A1I6CQI6_9RHOB|nr:efflux RND transporter periplasmic adaptor subunit [Poseidonocella sedimentorum]SFQ95451.1 membrane fusion protein, multidrug efflux system [Poseidonocella sedimentorum]